MELKSVTVQMKIRGRDETHELTWDPKAKAYVSASGTVKVKDPKAKKVEVLIRKTVLDKWDTFKGQCGVGGSNEEICKIDDKKRHQQITVRFAPTAKAAEANRGFFADYVYTDDEVKEGIKEWVTDKIAQGELKGPAAPHLKALENQLKGHKLTKDEMWMRLEAYTQAQRDSVRNRKPLFKWVPRTPIQIVISPPKSTAVVANAKAAITNLDRSIKNLKANKKSYQDLNRAGEKVWFAMQPLLKSTDPNVVAVVKQLKEARSRYNRACQDAIQLVQRKVDQTMARLDASGQRLEKASEKGPARAFQEARRAFKSQCNATRKAIIAASQILILPDEKTSLGAGLVLKRMTDLDVLEKAGLSLTYSEKPAAPPPVREAAPPPPLTPPAVKDAQRAVQRLSQHASFLPKAPADGSLYDKSVMDDMHRKGKLSRLHVLASELAKVKALVASLDQRDPAVVLLRGSLDSIVLKVSAAQSYLIREKIDINSATIFNYRAQPPLHGPDRESDYDWLKDRTKRYKALAIADGVVKGLKALMGDSSKRLAKDILWKADTLFGVTGKENKVNDFKEVWEQAFAIKASSYNYEKRGRTPYRAPIEAAKPSGPAKKEPIAPTIPVTTQKAFAAVERAYNRLYIAARLGDQERKFIYEEEIASIGKLLEDAKKQMDALPDSIDDSSGEVAKHYLKLTKAQSLFGVLKTKPVKRGAAVRPQVADASAASVSAAQRAAHMQYSPIRNALKSAIAEANSIYNRFFDEAGNPKLQTLSATQVAQYRDYLQRLDRKLEAHLSDELRNRLPREDQAEWDGLQPEKSIAQGKVSDVIARINVIEETARAAAPVPAAKTPPPAVSERDQTPTELSEEVQRLRGLATAAGTLTDAVAHRDALIRILIEAQRRGLKALEGSARRSLRVANEKVVNLGGSASEPKPSAPEPASTTQRIDVDAAKAKQAEAARAAAEAAKSKQEAQAREAAETKAKHSAATQDTTRLKERYEKIAQGLKDAKSIADVDTYETEIKVAIETLTKHAAIIGPYAQGIQGRYETLLKRLPALRAELEAAERYAALQSEVSALGTKANSVMQQGEAILGKPVVDPTDTPKLQALVNDLSDIEASLKRIFDGLTKEQDALKNRISGILGRIHEVTGKMSDRIQLQTSLAQKDKVAVVDALEAESKGLIKKSEALRKEGKKAADQLKLIHVRLVAIDKNLEAILKLLPSADPLKERIPELQIDILAEAEKIEKITGPLKPEPAKPAVAPLPGDTAQPLPEPATGTVPQSVEPPSGPPKPVPPTPAPVVGAAAKIGEIRGRVSEIRLKVDQFASEVMSNSDLASEGTFRGFLSDLATVERDLNVINNLVTDSSVASDAVALKSSMESLKNNIIDTAAFVLKLACNGTALRSMKLDLRLAKLQEFGRKLDELKSKTADDTTQRSVAATRAVIQEQIDSLESKKTGEPIANIVGRLNSLDHFRNKVRQSTDGRSIIIESVGKDNFKASSTIVDLFRALRPIDSDTPERRVVAATVQVYPNEIVQETMPFKTLFTGRGITDVAVIADPGSGQAQVTVTLFFDKSSVDAQRKSIMAGADKVLADRKKEGEKLEAQRLEPLQGVDAVARTRGGKAVEMSVPFAVEGKAPVNNRFYGSRITVTSAADVLAYVDRVRNQMSLDPNELVMIAVGSEGIAKELQSGLSPDTRDKAVFLASGLPTNALVLITRSAYSNDSYKGKEYPFEPLKSSGQTFNVAVGDWAKDKPPYRVFYPVMQKLGVTSKLIERLFPQAVKKAQAQPAPIARPVDERTAAPSSASPSPQSPPPSSGSIMLPKVYNTIQVSDKFLSKQFGLKPTQAAIYQSSVPISDLDNPDKLTQRIANIQSHAKALGMDHVLVIYRGVTKAGRDHYNQFVELVKKSDPELKFMHTTRIEQGTLADTADDVVHFVLLRDASVLDEQIAAKLKAYLKKQMDESH